LSAIRTSDFVGSNGQPTWGFIGQLTIFGN
jgi:hypothetical protein